MRDKAVGKLAASSMVGFLFEFRSLGFRQHRGQKKKTNPKADKGTWKLTIIMMLV
jgi:hypothetical protein